MTAFECKCVQETVVDYTHYYIPGSFMSCMNLCADRNTSHGGEETVGGGADVIGLAPLGTGLVLGLVGFSKPGTGVVGGLASTKELPIDLDTSL